MTPKRLCSAMVCLVGLHVVCAWGAETPDVTMSVVAEWGWGGAQDWKGTVDVEGGTIVRAEGYLMDPGEKGVFEVTPHAFGVDCFTAGLTDGACFSVRGPLSAEVVLQLGPKPVRFRLSDILAERQTFVVTEEGCKVVVSRDPRDSLRLVPMCEDLVLTPGEKIPLRVIPNPITDDGKDVAVSLSLTIDGGSAQAFKAVIQQGKPTEWEVAVRAPRTEGACSLIAEAKGSGLDSARARLDVVVVDPDAPPERPAALERRLVDRIDCTDPEDRHAYLGDPGTTMKTLPLGPCRVTSTKGRPAGNRTDTHGHMGWFAYRLEVQNAGRCHIMEMAYPDDGWRTVGVSIFEPNAVGKLAPVQLDSGFHTGGEHRTASKPAAHSLIFWPRTREPIVLVTNQQDGADAAVSEIRLYEAAKGLPALRVRAPASGPQRLLGIYYEEPKVVENFGGVEVEAGGRSLADWRTFYDAGRHLVDYMTYVGMNAVLLMSHGYQSTLYPTALTGHVHRYDKWNLFPDGRDPFQKDLLELYCRLFERDGLYLIPSIDFEQLIPQLEATRSSGETGLADIDLVRNDGVNSSAFWSRGTGRNRLSPHYNPLHPAVQQAMVDIVSEAARRYAEHRSFAGIAIQHRGLAFVQYPGLEYGYGDYTIRLFEGETGRKIPIRGDDPDRFMKRYEWLLKHARTEWVDWRCRKLHGLMLTLRDAMREARSDLTLHVAYMNTFQSILVTDDARDWYASGKSLHELFRVKGLDPALYMNDDGIVVTRPVRQGPQSRYVRKYGEKRGPIARDLQLSGEVNRLYSRGPRSAALTFHEYYESRLQDFDDVAWMPSRTWLVGTIAPAGRNNLERYASWMAGFDPSTIFDGGWQVPMGRETEMREFAAEYRPLPRQPFAPLPLNLEPVVCRTTIAGNSLVFYLVNQAPYPVQTRLSLDTQSEIVSLATGLTVGAGALDLALPPFALRSFRAPFPAAIEGASTSIPEDERLRLEGRVQQLQNRKAAWLEAISAAKHVELLRSCDFTDAPLDQLPTGWRPHPKDSTAWTVVDDDEHGRALSIESTGDRLHINGPPFDPGPHQAIQVTAHLRGTRKTRARLFVTGNVDGTFWSAQTEVALTPQPRPVVLTIPELPPGQKRTFSVRVDIMRAGKLWLHGFTVAPATIDPQVGSRILTTIDQAGFALAEKHYAQLERLLDSYWGKAALREQ
ncbi:MAG: family 10 glycosylhydrolase [Lentisphaerae bacterium]|jgi:hypothetical protein|nr:family 10 glycosylhydrolase [Lentisphaerota bacterium]MBT5613076.1 family 10 glycosylhydrolase [Lentisphaerota bacterium]MBT7059335.1 family 10 glycosylhydrolase [Lentisphaerota bacterium]MBT7841831.1 family 10 glycosylhydrolase [Lentisphaerota bacterium]